MLTTVENFKYCISKDCSALGEDWSGVLYIAYGVRCIPNYAPL